MSNRIIRFGGSSIGNTRSIQNLQTYLEQDIRGRIFIVVSAVPKMLQIIEDSILSVFSKQFNVTLLESELNEFYNKTFNSGAAGNYKELVKQLINLLKGISLTGDYSASLKDQVVSYSEKLTAEIFSLQWKNLGGDCRVIFPEEIGLEVTSDFGNATFVSVNTDKIESLQKKVFVIPGSYGVNKKGKIARTGKTAADYTASALTSFLNAEKLELWALDKKFQKADPNIIENPTLINRLTYAEASELAYFDHYSFHPRTVELLEQKHIPIYVLSPESSKGLIETTINTETFIDDRIVKSVACSEDISLIKLDGPGVGLKPGILAKVTSKLNEAGINIKSVITSQTAINLILEKCTGDRSLNLVEGLGFTSVQNVSLQKNVSLIGIIGHGMQQNYGISARIFNAVAQYRINVILSGSGASELVSYLIVKDADKEKSVRMIYDAFFSIENK